MEADLSQAELRIAAWMSGDPVMLRIYREGGDIHAMTAARVMGITLEAFNALDDETRGHKRFMAKADELRWPNDEVAKTAIPLRPRRPR